MPLQMLQMPGVNIQASCDVAAPDGYAMGGDGGNCRRGCGIAARVAGVCAALILSGCASSPKWLENRIALTADGKEAHVLSVWGPISIGSKIADSDAKAIISALEQRKP